MNHICEIKVLLIRVESVRPQSCAFQLSTIIVRVRGTIGFASNVCVAFFFQL